MQFDAKHNYDLVIIKNFFNFNFLTLNRISYLFFFFNFHNIHLLNLVLLTLTIKKNINLTFYKIIKKNVFLEKKKIKFYFNNNNFFVFNKIIKNYKSIDKNYQIKKNKNTLLSKIFNTYYRYFSKIVFFPLIGVFKNKLLLLNEKVDFFLLKNNDLTLKLKKKKHILNKNLLFFKNIINFFFYLNQKKQISNENLFKLSSEFFIKIKNKFSKKNNFSRNFLFLNNNIFSKNIRLKFNNFTEMALALENFYFSFYLNLKKKFLFFKNYKNKYFRKAFFNLNAIDIKKKNFKKSFFVYYLNFFKKKLIINTIPNGVSKPIVKKNFNKLNNKYKIWKHKKLKNKFNFFWTKIVVNVYTKKKLKKKSKPLFTFLNSFFKLKKFYLFYFNYLNFAIFKKYGWKKKKYKYNKVFFLRCKKNLLFFFQKYFFFKNISFLNYNFTRLAPTKIYLNNQNIKHYFKFYNFFFINEKKKHWLKYLFFKNNFHKFNLPLTKLNFSSVFNNSIFFFSKNNYFFFNAFNGFMYLQKFIPCTEDVSSISSVKKTIYSFLGKNDLQRYILKKYLKNFSIFNYDNNSALKQIAFSRQYEDGDTAFNTVVSQLILKKNQYYFEKNLYFTKNFYESSNEMSIKKIKFKPGYMTMWREARSVLNKVWNLNFKYQQRLTKYLLAHQKHVKHFYVFTEDFKLLNILVFSRLVLDMDTASNFIKNGLIFINGFQVTDLFFQIFKNDFIQCVISIKYYILYKNLLNFSLLKKIRLRHKSRAKLHSFQLDDNKQRSRSFSYWMINNKHILMDTPNFLEVDYFTLSIFCLYTNIQLNARSPYSFIDIRYGVLNLYNWKYIN